LKKYLWVLILSISSFAANVASPVLPSSESDVYPIVYSRHISGGWHEVADLTARDAITAERRLLGMVAFCNYDSSIYQLVGGTTNSNWVKWNIKLGTIDSVAISDRSHGIISSGGGYAHYPAFPPDHGLLNWHSVNGLGWVNYIDSSGYATNAGNAATANSASYATTAANSFEAVHATTSDSAVVSDRSHGILAAGGAYAHYPAFPGGHGVLNYNTSGGITWINKPDSSFYSDSSKYATYSATTGRRIGYGVSGGVVWSAANGKDTQSTNLTWDGTNLNAGEYTVDVKIGTSSGWGQITTGVNAGLSLMPASGKSLRLGAFYGYAKLTNGIVSADMKVDSAVRADNADNASHASSADNATHSTSTDSAHFSDHSKGILALGGATAQYPMFTSGLLNYDAVNGLSWTRSPIVDSLFINNRGAVITRSTGDSTIKISSDKNVELFGGPVMLNGNSGANNPGTSDMDSRKNITFLSGPSNGHGFTRIVSGGKYPIESRFKGTIDKDSTIVLLYFQDTSAIIGHGFIVVRGAEDCQGLFQFNGSTGHCYMANDDYLGVIETCRLSVGGSSEDPGMINLRMSGKNTLIVKNLTTTALDVYIELSAVSW
jgi:hypothetical protein